MGSTLRVLCAFLFCACSAFAEDTSLEHPTFMPFEASKALIRHSVLSVDDNVDGNCWTNSQSIRSKIYLLFEQNEIFVPDYNPQFINYETVFSTLSATGYRTSNGMCAVSAKFEVNTRVHQVLGGARGTDRYQFGYIATLFSRAAIFTAGTNSDSQLTEFFDGAAAQFVAEVIVARRSSEFQAYREEFPVDTSQPMSEEEWQEFMSKLNVTNQ